LLGHSAVLPIRISRPTARWRELNFLRDHFFLAAHEYAVLVELCLCETLRVVFVTLARHRKRKASVSSVYIRPSVRPPVYLSRGPFTHSHSPGGSTNTAGVSLLANCQRLGTSADMLVV